MSNTYDTEKAVSAVAAHLIEQDEVQELVGDLTELPTQVRQALAAMPAAKALVRWIDRLNRMESAEGDRLIREGYESREEGRAWERELARERAA